MTNETQPPKRMQLYTKILIAMVLGAVLGFLVGPNSGLLPQDGVRLDGETVTALAKERARVDRPWRWTVMVAGVLVAAWAGNQLFHFF